MSISSYRPSGAEKTLNNCLMPMGVLSILYQFSVKSGESTGVQIWMKNSFNCPTYHILLLIYCYILTMRRRAVRWWTLCFQLPCNTSYSLTQTLNPRTFSLLRALCRFLLVILQCTNVHYNELNTQYVGFNKRNKTVLDTADSWG